MATAPLQPPSGSGDPAIDWALQSIRDQQAQRRMDSGDDQLLDRPDTTPWVDPGWVEPQDATDAQIRSLLGLDRAGEPRRPAGTPAPTPRSLSLQAAEHEATNYFFEEPLDRIVTTEEQLMRDAFGYDPDYEANQRFERGIQRMRGEGGKLAIGFQNYEQYQAFKAGWHERLESYKEQVGGEGDPYASGWATGPDAGFTGVLRTGVSLRSAVGDWMEGGGEEAERLRRGGPDAETMTPAELKAAAQYIHDEKLVAFVAGQQSYTSTVTEPDTWSHMIMSTAPGIAVTLATVGGGALYFAAQSSGTALHEYGEAVRAGEFEYDQADAAVFAGITASIEFAAERVSGKLLRGFGRGIAGRFMGEPGKRLAARGLAKANAKARAVAARAAARGVPSSIAHYLVKSALVEGAEEGATTLLTAGIRPLFTQEEYSEWGDIMSETLHSAWAGAVMGVAFSPAFAGRGAIDVGLQKRAFRKRIDAAYARNKDLAENSQERVFATADAAFEAVNALPEEHREAFVKQLEGQSGETTAGFVAAVKALEEARAAAEEHGDARGEQFALLSRQLEDANNDYKRAMRDGDKEAASEALNSVVGLSQGISKLSPTLSESDSWTGAVKEIADAQEAGESALDPLARLKRSYHDYVVKRNTKASVDGVVNSEAAHARLLNAEDMALVAQEAAITSHESHRAGQAALAGQAEWSLSTSEDVIARNHRGITASNAKTDADNKAAQFASNVLGLNVVFYDGDEAAPAFWDPRTPDTIYMRSGSTDAREAISQAVHEGTHFLQFTDPTTYKFLQRVLSGKSILDAAREYALKTDDPTAQDFAMVDIANRIIEEAESGEIDEDLTVTDRLGMFYLGTEGAASLIEAAANKVGTSKWALFTARLGIRGRAALGFAKAVKLIGDTAADQKAKSDPRLDTPWGPNVDAKNLAMYRTLREMGVVSAVETRGQREIGALMARREAEGAPKQEAADADVEAAPKAPSVSADSKPGDKITVYSAEGVPQEVEVVAVGKGGAVKIRRADGTEEMIDAAVDARSVDPLAEDYEMSGIGSTPEGMPSRVGRNVSELSDEELAKYKQALQEWLDGTDGLKQTADFDRLADLYSLMAESKRRAGKDVAGQGTLYARGRRVTEAHDANVSLESRERPGRNDAVEDVRKASHEYLQGIGRDTDLGEDEYVGVDLDRAKRIADLFEDLPDMTGESVRAAMDDPEIREAYEAMADETIAQYEFLTDRGYTFTPMAGEGEPYPGSAAMIDELRSTKHIRYYKTLNPDDPNSFGAATQDAIDADHPLLRHAGGTVKDTAGNDHVQTVNDLFRAIHDVFGHGSEGFQFGPRGEENAWRKHARMFTPKARRAMTIETRGQNSWVNFGEHLRRDDGTVPERGDVDFISPDNFDEKPFAQQKVDLLPEWVSTIDAPSPELDVSLEARGLRSKDHDSRIAGKITSKITTEDIRDSVPEDVRLGGEPNTYEDGESVKLIDGRPAGSDEVIKSKTVYPVEFTEEDMEQVREQAAETMGQDQADEVVRVIQSKKGEAQQGDRGLLPLLDVNILNNTFKDKGLTNEERFWFEASALSVFDRLVGLVSGDRAGAIEALTLFADLLSATSPQAAVFQNFRRALGVYVDKLKADPNWMGMQSAKLVRKALVKELRLGDNYKTGSFAPAFLHVLGMEPDVPLTTNDIWQAYLFGFRNMKNAKESDQYPGSGDNSSFSNPYVYKYISVYIGHVTKLMNEKIRSTPEYKAAKAKFDAGEQLTASEAALITPWTPGQMMAYPWSHMSHSKKAKEEQGSFASAVDTVIGELDKAGHEAVVDLPDGRKGIDLAAAAAAEEPFSDTLEPSTKARRAQLATIEVTPTGTDESKLESKIRARIDEELTDETLKGAARKKLEDLRGALLATHGSFMKWLVGKGSGRITVAEKEDAKAEKEETGEKVENREATALNQAIANAMSDSGDVVVPALTKQHSMFGQLFAAITGRRLSKTQNLKDITDPTKPIRIVSIAEGTDKHGVGASGIYKGDVSPNLILSLAGLTHEQRVLLLRVLGSVLKQEAMAASRFADSPDGMVNPVPSATIYTEGRSMPAAALRRVAEIVKERANTSGVTVVPSTSGDVLFVSDPLAKLTETERGVLVSDIADVVGGTVSDGYSDVLYLSNQTDSEYSRGHEPIVEGIIEEDAAAGSQWMKGLSRDEQEAIKEVAPTPEKRRVLLRSGGAVQGVRSASPETRRTVGRAVGRSRGWRIHHALTRITEQQAKFQTELGRVAGEVESELGPPSLDAREGVARFTVSYSVVERATFQDGKKVRGIPRRAHAVIEATDEADARRIFDRNKRAGEYTKLEMDQRPDHALDLPKPRVMVRSVERDMDDMSLEAREQLPIGEARERGGKGDVEAARVLAAQLRSDAKKASPKVAAALRAAAKSIVSEAYESRKERVELKKKLSAQRAAGRLGFREGMAVGRKRLKQALHDIKERSDERDEKQQKRNLRIRLRAEERVGKLADRQARLDMAHVHRATTAAISVMPMGERGRFLGRALKAKSLHDVTKIAHEVHRAMVKSDAQATINDIKKMRDRLFKRGMSIKTRDELKRLFDLALGLLTGPNNRLIQLDSMTDLVSRVIRAKDHVEDAVNVFQDEYTSWKEGAMDRQERLRADREEEVGNMRATGKPRKPKALASQKDEPNWFARRWQGSLDADGLFETLAGKDSVLLRAWNMIRAAKGRMWKQKRDINDRVEEAIRRAGYEGKDDFLARTTTMYGEGSAETLTVTLGGEEMTIPISDALGLAAMDDETFNLLLKDEQAIAEAIEEGDTVPGIVWREASERETVQATQEEVSIIREALGDEHMQLIADLKSIIEEQIRPPTFKVFYEQYGKEPPHVENYWPRARNRSELGEDLVGDSFTSPDLSGPSPVNLAVNSMLDNVGFMKDRRGGGGSALVIGGLFEVFDRHVEDSLKLIHLSQPLRGFDGLLRGRRLAAMLVSRLGDDGVKKIREQLAYAVGLTGQNVGANIFGRLQSNIAGAYLMLAPKTWGRMFGGVFRLLSEIRTGAYLRGLTKVENFTPGVRGQWVTDIEEYNGYFYDRHRRSQVGRYSNLLQDPRAQRHFMLTFGAFGRALRNSGEDGAADGVKRLINVIRASGNLVKGLVSVMRGFDHVLRGIDRQIMLIAVQGHMAEGMTFEEAVDAAEMTFRRTQNTSDPADDVMDAARIKGNIKGSKQILHAILLFSSDPVKANNQIRTAWRDRGEDPGKAARTIGAIGLNSALSAYVGYMFAATLFALVDDDEEDSDRDIMSRASMEKEGHRAKRRLLEEAVSQGGGLIGFIASSAVYFAEKSLSGQFSPSDPLEVPSVEAINKLARSGGDAVRKGWNEELTPGDVGSAALDGMTLIGLPFAAPFRIFRQIDEALAEPETADVLKVLRARKRDGTLTSGERLRLEELEEERKAEQSRARRLKRIRDRLEAAR